jgi:DNA-binding CsgD family transcriptional regulator/tetratricopeptide (TPR) repeat protein
VDEHLLERDDELAVLVRAVDDAAEGRSSVVLLLGEAGIGKTSLVRAFLESVSDRTRPLVGTCDDLLTPRTFGPLRDAAAENPGPLADAFAGDPDQEAVYQALRLELQPRGKPTVLVVEDLHWADDATLDALRYVCRRLNTLTATVVLTYRDDDIDETHSLRRLLGALATQPVQRLRLRPLSRRAVATLGAKAGVDAASVFTTTRGNPFFVTEVLACSDGGVPATVVDAVMARIRQLPLPTRAALEQLAVVPSRVPPLLGWALVGDVAVLEEAEQRRILEVRADGVSFRHELARRALLRSIPRTRQVALHENVLKLLLEEEHPDLSRVMHHAVAAGDVTTVLSSGREAARQAARAGSHRQSLAHYEQVVKHLPALAPEVQASVLIDYSWELYVAQRWGDAVQAGLRALAICERLGDRVAQASAMVVLSRSYFMAGRPVEALEEVERAVALLEPTGDLAALALAETYLGAVQALTERQDEALPRLRAAQSLAQRAGRRDLVALCNNYIGCARVDLGDVEAGLDDLRRSLRLALDLPHHEYAGRAYTNLAETTFQLHRFDELTVWIEDGVQFTTDHDLPGHRYNLEAHRALLLLSQGRWHEAETRLRRLVAAVPEPGQLTRLTLPPLGRLLARRGEDGAAALLGRAWDLAVSNGSLAALAPAGLALIESAWLAGDIHRADEQITLLMRRTTTPGAARSRGELLRYLGRAGLAVEEFPGCPPEWAAGIAGAWQQAADEWAKIGDPYERALELASSRNVDACLEALDVLDDLGAVAAGRQVRGVLRQLGVARIPRGRLRATRENPAGLTERQVDVLALLATGLTNAEIAERLVVSTRTVDHHVSAILTRLEVGSRRDAARRATELGLAPEVASTVSV